MSRSALHPTVVQDPPDVQFVSTSLATMVDARRLTAATAVARADDADIRVIIDSVSKDLSFDAYIHVGLAGGGHPDIKLMVDSGNSTLILPHFEAISQLPDFAKIYHVAPGVVTEPWGAPAKLVTGPIVLPCEGGTYTIARCQFYACIGLNRDNDYTANFGIGCVVPWTAADPYGLQSPLSCVPDYNYVQIDYAPVEQVLSVADQPHVAPGSWLTLSKTQPDGYPMMFDILPGTPWMSLKPLSLEIGDGPTPWPGTRQAASIAMIDTGGGPVFLSDPENYLGKLDFPGAVPEEIPDFWTASCAGISDDLAFSLGDGAQSMSFSLPTNALPASVQGLSLVACQNCSFMFGWDGMNVGGLTALFYSILIDYKNAKVGFSAKSPDV